MHSIKQVVFKKKKAIKYFEKKQIKDTFSNNSISSINLIILIDQISFAIDEMK